MEAPPVLGGLELVEGFPVAEIARNVTVLCLGPRECLCALVQPCTCVTQSVRHAGANPAQQNRPCCPSWWADSWFNIHELPGQQGLVVF